MSGSRPRALLQVERMLLAALVCALVAIVAWKPPERHARESLAARLALLQRQAGALEKQPNASCPEQWGRLATERDLRIAMFYGYANFDDVVLDSGFAIAMASALRHPCRGSMAACDFALVRQDAHFVRLRKSLGDRTATIDVRWTSLGESDDRNREGARQTESSRATKEEFYRALTESDVVLYTGHSRGGGGFGFDPSSKVDIALDAIFRSPAKAIDRAMAARPSRLALLAALACDSDEYYARELRAANPDASLVLARGNISSDQTDPINLGILNAVLGLRCREERDASLVSVAAPGSAVRWIEP